jgi:hypothetical protein
MSTQFPFLSKTLGIKQSKIYPDIPWQGIDRRTIRTRDSVAGILLLSELREQNPDFNGKLEGRISTHREDIKHGVDYRIFDKDGRLLIDVDFTMSNDRFLQKKRNSKNPIQIILINSQILLWVAHVAEEICKTNPRTSKEDIIHRIPLLKTSSKSIILKIC